MSKHWNPPRQTIAVKPSRIRREPIRVEPTKAPVYSEEQEIAVGVIGIVLFALALAVVIVGISIFTLFKPDPAALAADSAKFGQCYNSDGQNCVVDGGTLYIGSERVLVAGIEAPQINGARCAEERDRGIAAAIGLSNLLQAGNVTMSPSFRDEYGRTVRRVAVKGRDVAEYMTTHSLDRAFTGQPQNWCS